LARAFAYPKEPTDLLRVSQYVAMMMGSGELYDALRHVFDADYEPNLLHQFLARLPAILREREAPAYQLIVTTNYDDALERAFRMVGEPFDLVSYIAEGDDRGKFLHVLPDGEAYVIHRTNEYDRLSLAERSIILKIHGAVDRANPDRDSYVITEDHYIDYLTRTDITDLVPKTLEAKLRRSHFLFLGYSLQDWNLRVILHRIWGQQKLKFTSWAVQLAPELVEEGAWLQRGVRIINAELGDYIVGLSDAVGDLLRVDIRP
jgi:hypothetical protein